MLTSSIGWNLWCHGHCQHDGLHHCCSRADASRRRIRSRRVVRQTSSGREDRGDCSEGSVRRCFQTPISPHARVVHKCDHGAASHRRIHQRNRPPDGHHQPASTARRLHNPPDDRRRREENPSPGRSQAERRQLHDRLPQRRRHVSAPPPAAPSPSPQCKNNHGRDARGTPRRTPLQTLPVLNRADPPPRRPTLRVLRPRGIDGKPRARRSHPESSRIQRPPPARVLRRRSSL